MSNLAMCKKLKNELKKLENNVKYDRKEGGLREG